jgi:hypothetical protein
MIPAEWEEYIANAEKGQARRPSDAPKKPQVQKGKMMSPRQRRAFQGTSNFARSVYDGDKSRNQAIVAKDTEIDGGPKLWTWNVGGNCEGPSGHGKDTSARS